MTHEHSTVAVFNAHGSAEPATSRLPKDGFPIARLRIIGKAYQAEEQVVRFFNQGT